MYGITQSETTPPQPKKRRNKIPNRIRWHIREQEIKHLPRADSISLACVIIATKFQKYNVKPETIERDWRRRSKWIPTLHTIEDLDLKAAEVSLALHNIVVEGYVLYELCKKQNNLSAAVGSLRLCKEGILEEAVFLQGLGKLTSKTPDLEIQTQGLPFQFDPEVKAVLLASHLKQKEEKRIADIEYQRTHSDRT